MKKIWTAVLALIMMTAPFRASGIVITVIHTNPSLAAAINAQTAALTSMYTARLGLQASIKSSELAIQQKLKQIHGLEIDQLEYLSTAQEAMRSAYLIQRIIRLSSEIANGSVQVINAIPKNADGIVKDMVVDAFADVSMQIADCVPLMKALVTSRTYTPSAYDEHGNRLVDRGEVNILNGAERYSVAQELEMKLMRISSAIRLLRDRVKYSSVGKLISSSSLENYYRNRASKDASTAQRLIEKWNSR